MAKQNADDKNAAVQEKISGSTSKHTYNVPPASLGQSGAISPNSDKRGKQG
jgi:hypothetical protein